MVLSFLERDSPVPGDHHVRIIGAGIADCIWDLDGISGGYYLRIARVRGEQDVDILLDSGSDGVRDNRTRPFRKSLQERSSSIRPVEEPGSFF